MKRAVAFVDVHSHVVPSGDDGVGSEEEGLALCGEAARRGTAVLYATPHVWPHRPLSPEREDRVRAAHRNMAAAAGETGLDLRLGFELTPAPSLLDEDFGRYRLGDLPAVLMELPFTGPLDVAEEVAEAIERQGLTPVLGHPERAEAAEEDQSRLREYSERGWLLQVNGTSLLGYHGPDEYDLGWRLVEDGLADLVGSDGHRWARPPFLDEAYDAVRRRLGEAADPLFDGSALARLEPLAVRDGADLAERR